MASTGHSAPPSDAVSGELPQAAGGALILPDDAEIYIRDTSHYRAKMFIPCTYGQCPGRMQLRVAYADNRPIERPYYLCDQNGKDMSVWTCPQSKEGVYPEEIRTEHVMEAGKKRYYKSNESRTQDEMRTML